MEQSLHAHLSSTIIIQTTRRHALSVCMNGSMHMLALLYTVGGAVGGAVGLSTWEGKVVVFPFCAGGSSSAAVLDP